jgi:hypothetical protein
MFGTQVAPWSFISVTNPLERLQEIKRRTNEVGIFPNRASLVRIVATLLHEQDDEWQVADRRYFSAGSMSHIDELGGGDTRRDLLAQIEFPHPQLLFIPLRPGWRRRSLESRLRR